MGAQRKASAARSAGVAADSSEATSWSSSPAPHPNCVAAAAMVTAMIAPMLCRMPDLLSVRRSNSRTTVNRRRATVAHGAGTVVQTVRDGARPSAHPAGQRGDVGRLDQLDDEAGLDGGAGGVGVRRVGAERVVLLPAARS